MNLPYSSPHSARTDFDAITQWRAVRIRELAALENKGKDADADDLVLREKASPLLNEAARWRNAENLRAYVAAVMKRVPHGEAAHSWARHASSVADELDPVARRARLFEKAQEVPAVETGISSDPLPTPAERNQHTLKELLALAEATGPDFEQGFRYLHHFAKNDPYGTPPQSLSEFVRHCKTISHAGRSKDDEQTIQRACVYLTAVSHGKASADALAAAWEDLPLLPASI